MPALRMTGAHRSAAYRSAAMRLRLAVFRFDSREAHPKGRHGQDRRRNLEKQAVDLDLQLQPIAAHFALKLVGRVSASHQFHFTSTVLPWRPGGDGRRRSLAGLGVDPDGDRAVVDEADLHVGAEMAGGDGAADLGA